MYSPMYSKLYDAMRSAVSSDGYPVMYWTPLDLFGLGSQGFWYDPSDLSTLFQDVAGTVPVTAVGQPVALMLDKSGRGNHLSINVPASRPILRQNATTGAYYLATDGADDYMVSAPIDFTGTDSVSLFSGMRKLSDAGTAVFAEFSASVTANQGAFAVFAPSSSGLPRIAFLSRGTLQANATYDNAAVAAPVSLVATASGQISADVAALRVNGAAAAQSLADQGSGNYGNHPLYLFRRGGTSLPWAGHFYGLVGVGRLTTAAETMNVERWLARKVGVAVA